MLHHFDVLAFAVVRKRNAGVEERVLEVSVGAAVDLVGAAFGREVINAAVSDPPEFRRKVRGLQGELLDGFHRWLQLVGHPRLAGAVRFLAFEHNLEVVVAAVDGDVIPAIESGARRHLRKRQRVPDRPGANAEVERQFVDLLARNGGGLLGAFGLQLRRIRRYLHRFRRRAHFQHDVDAGGHRHLHLNIGLLIFAETALLNGERVSTGRQGECGVVTGAGGSRGALGAGIRIRQGDVNVGHQRAGGVGDRAGDGSAIALGERR